MILYLYISLNVKLNRQRRSTEHLLFGGDICVILRYYCHWWTHRGDNPAWHGPANFTCRARHGGRHKRGCGRNPFHTTGHPEVHRTRVAHVRTSARVWSSRPGIGQVKYIWYRVLTEGSSSVCCYSWCACRTRADSCSPSAMRSSMCVSKISIKAQRASQSTRNCLTAERQLFGNNFIDKLVSISKHFVKY